MRMCFERFSIAHGVFYKSLLRRRQMQRRRSRKRWRGSAAPHLHVHVVRAAARRTGSKRPSSIVWLYHSHVNDQRDVDSGLVGAIVVMARGEANPDGTPKGVDREFVALFEMFDESQSWYLDPAGAETLPKKPRGATRQ